MDPRFDGESVEANRVSAAVEAELTRYAVPNDVAAVAARWIAEAEALQLGAFGLAMLVKDLERIGPPVLRGRATSCSTAADSTAAGSIDAKEMPGIAALALAVGEAHSRARSVGAAVMGVRAAGGLGVLGLAARSLAHAGFVGIVAAQAPAFVTPWGGSGPVVGTNPIALAVPRVGAPPLVLDFATAPLTMAEVAQRAAANEPLPPGVALDDAGVPTDAASAVAALVPESRTASLLGLFIELLAGATVGAIGEHVGEVVGRGAVVIAIDPACTGGVNAARAAEALGHRWRAGGGHLPARFDALPEPEHMLDAQIGLTQRSAAALHYLEERARR